MPKPVRRKRILFTTKKVSVRAVMSDLLGAISLTSVILAFVLAFRKDGVSAPNEAAAFVESVAMALAGLVLAIFSRREPDRYYFFSYLGMALNGLVLAAGIVVLYLGIR